MDPGAPPSHGLTAPTCPRRVTPRIFKALHWVMLPGLIDWWGRERTRVRGLIQSESVASHRRRGMWQRCSCGEMPRVHSWLLGSPCLGTVEAGSQSGGEEAGQGRGRGAVSQELTPGRRQAWGLAMSHTLLGLPQVQSSLSHQTSLVKHEFKDKTVKNFKQVTTEH